MAEIKFIGKPIEEVLGAKVRTIDVYVSSLSVPTLKLAKIILEDGRTFHVEGEHDHPYLPIDMKEMNREVIYALTEENDMLEEVKEEFDE
jgi:hypothetical protein